MPNSRTITLTCLSNIPIRESASSADAVGPHHRRITLKPDENETIILGRASRNYAACVQQPSNNNALFRNRVLSKQHARIGCSTYQDLYIEDLGSLHGTYVNNVPLSPGKKIPLKHQDILQLGVCFRDDKGWIDSVRMRVDLDEQLSVMKSAPTEYDLEGPYDGLFNRVQMPTPDPVETSDSNEHRSSSSSGSGSNYSSSDDLGVGHDRESTSPVYDVYDEIDEFSCFSDLNTELSKNENMEKDGHDISLLDIYETNNDHQENACTMPGSYDDPTDQTPVYAAPIEDAQTTLVKNYPALIELAESLQRFVVLHPSTKDGVEAITTNALKSMIQAMDTEEDTCTNSVPDKPQGLSLYGRLVQIQEGVFGRQFGSIRQENSPGRKRKRDEIDSNRDVVDKLCSAIETKVFLLSEKLNCIDWLDSKSHDEFREYAETFLKHLDEKPLRDTNFSPDEAELVSPEVSEDAPRKANKTSEITSPGQFMELSSPKDVSPDHLRISSRGRSARSLATITAAATAVFTGAFLLGGTAMLAFLAGMPE